MEWDTDPSQLCLLESFLKGLGHLLHLLLVVLQPTLVLLLHLLLQLGQLWVAANQANPLVLVFLFITIENGLHLHFVHPLTLPPLSLSILPTVLIILNLHLVAFHITSLLGFHIIQPHNPCSFHMINQTPRITPWHWSHSPHSLHSMITTPLTSHHWSHNPHSLHITDHTTTTHFISLITQAPLTSYHWLHNPYSLSSWGDSMWIEWY